MTCGIYRITNTVNGKFYIGRSVHIENRWYHHKSDLSGNTGRPNVHLQAAWNKYGSDKFVFSILVVCDEPSLVAVEQASILSVDKKFLYNKSLIVDDSNYGLRRSAEKRAKMSESQQLAATPERNAKISETLRGRKFSPERRVNHQKAIVLSRGKQIVLKDGQSFESQTAFAKACGFAQQAGVGTLIMQGKTYDEIASSRGLFSGGKMDPVAGRNHVVTLSCGTVFSSISKFSEYIARPNSSVKRWLDMGHLPDWIVLNKGRG